MHTLHDTPAVDPRLDLPTRHEVRERLVALLEGSAAKWAWQGPTGAVDAWMTDDGPADLDVWWRPGSGPDALGVTGFVQRLCTELPAAPVADARDPRRLRHTSLVVRTATGLAVIDLTHGDLQVGPIVLLPERQVRSADDGSARLIGAAAVADLLLRPVLRGRIPPEPRVAQARAAWVGVEPADRDRALMIWRGGLGAAVVEALLEVLSGAPVTATLVSRARRRLVRATLAPKALPSTWSSRRTIVPAGGRATPLGLPGRGVVVAMVGTDGSGKSTVSAQLAERLEQAGFPTASAYFGMARGNLPGIALARRVLRVGGVQPAAPVEPGEPEGAGAAASLDRPGLRRAAAWFYAAEYVWRYQRTVAPHRRRGRVVLVDRYVYDLRESPWPGSTASRIAEALVPAPDVLVLPDAPDDVIHARKPERTAAEQAAIQDRYRRLIDERPARSAHVVVDTSGQTADPVGGLELAVISAAHGISQESTSASGAARS